MDPSLLIPQPDAIPVPWWVFEGLGVLTLALHLLVVNAVVGGSVLGLLRLLGHRASPLDLQARVPILLAVAINLGVAPLLFMQVTWGPFIYTSSILLAVPWLLVIPALIAAYYGSYLASSQRLGRRARLGVGALQVLLLLAVAFVYVCNMSLMQRPEAWPGWFEARDGWSSQLILSLSLADPTLLPRYLHFLVACGAVGGLATAGVQVWHRWRGGVEDEVLLRSGLRLFAWASLLQVAVGLWYLSVLPLRAVVPFLGADRLATGALFAGILLCAGAILSAFRGAFWPTSIQLLVILPLMVSMRALVRVDTLAPWFLPQHDLPQHTQAEPFAVFFVVAMGGLLVVYHLLRLGFARRAGEGRRA